MPTPNSPSHAPRPAPDGPRSSALALLLFGAGAAVVALLAGFFVWRPAGPPLQDRPAANRETALAPDLAPPPEQIPGEMEVIRGDLMSKPPDAPLPFAEETPPPPEPRPKEPARARVIVNSAAGSDKPAPDPGPKEPAKVHPPRTHKWAADQVVERRLEAGEDELRRELSAVPEVRLLSDSEVKNFRAAERDAQDPEAARLRAASAKVNAARQEVNAARRYLNANRHDPDAAAAERQAVLVCEAVEREFNQSQAARGRRQPTASSRAAVAHTWNLRLHDTLRHKALGAGLALGAGRDCQLALATAAEMAQLSKALRSMGFGTVPASPFRASSPRRRPRKAGASTITVAGAERETRPGKTAALDKWCEARPLEQMSGAVPTLAQMLQIEDEATRLLLVSELARLDGTAATAKLAERALVDLSPKVRQSALAALKERPASQYLSFLLWGLRYPWPPVADHAAVALRTLGPREAVAPLVGLLDLPSPSAPALDPETKQYKVREVVRLSHLRNCLLCHCPSADRKDGLVRGLVPTPGEGLPQLYYESQKGDFVRADITYLHQDFSLMLPDKQSGPWPREQRFDFVTRLRPAKSYEIDELRAPLTGYPQRDAVLYALRGIAGKDAGASGDRWRELLGIARPEKGFLPPTGPAAAR